MIKRKEIFRLCKDLTHARYELKDLLIGVDEANKKSVTDQYIEREDYKVLVSSAFETISKFFNPEDREEAIDFLEKEFKNSRPLSVYHLFFDQANAYLRRVRNEGSHSLVTLTYNYGPKEDFEKCPTAKWKKGDPFTARRIRNSCSSGHKYPIKGDLFNY